MKKVSLIFVIFALFAFAGCSDKKLDELDIPDTGTTDTDNPDTENPDSTDDQTNPTDDQIGRAHV